MSVVSEGVVGKSNDSRVVFGTGYSESRRESCWEICRIKIWSWWAQTMSHYSVIALLGELSHSSHLQPPIPPQVASPYRSLKRQCRIGFSTALIGPFLFSVYGFMHAAMAFGHGIWYIARSMVPKAFSGWLLAMESGVLPDSMVPKASKTRQYLLLQ